MTKFINLGDTPEVQMIERAPERLQGLVALMLLPIMLLKLWLAERKR